MWYTVFAYAIFALFGQFSFQKMGVWKLCKEFLEGIVLEVTFRLGPELGILFINLKWNISSL
jgi:hypothetical protein